MKYQSIFCEIYVTHHILSVEYAHKTKYDLVSAVLENTNRISNIEKYCEPSFPKTLPLNEFAVVHNT